MCSTAKRYPVTFVLVAAILACTAALPGCPPAGPAPGETRTFDGIEFQWCPAGTFTMGSPEGEVDRDEDEVQHEVTLGRGFWLGRYEVTQAQWERVMGDNPSEFQGASRPVEMVSWDDAQDFIAELNASLVFSDAEYRLPTEAEWEYACRSGHAERFYWGNDADESDIDDYAWYGGNSGDQSHFVGGKLPNNWGLRDMSGNVDEWCQDSYSAYPAGPVTDPQGPEDGHNRVLRGGTWWAGSDACRSANRNYNDPTSQFDDYGFRLLRTED